MANADLRPMTLGEVLDRMFRLYKDRFWLFTGIMCFPFLLLFCVNVGLVWGARLPVAAVNSGAPPQLPSATTVFAGMGGGLLVIAITFVVTGIGQAATIFAVSDLYLARPTSIRSAFKQVRGHILQVMGVIFLTGLIVGAGCILLVVPGIILACRTAVAVPAAMLEDATGGTAISRSMDLTKGFAMQVFLIFLLSFALSLGVSLVFQMPFTIMSVIPRPHILPFGVMVLQQALAFIGQVLIAPIASIAFCLMYYNLRVRKEGFDLEHLMTSLETGSVGGSATGTVMPA
jgi:hypothetical protein